MTLAMSSYLTACSGEVAIIIVLLEAGNQEEDLGMRLEQNVHTTKVVTYTLFDYTPEGHSVTYL